MPERRFRVLMVISHPVQYVSPVFRQMAQHPRLDIHVAYCSLQGAESGLDVDFGVEVKWDVPLLEGYPWQLVPNKSLRPGLQRFFGLVNPGLWKLVRTGGYDAVVIYTGYAYLSFWVALAAAKLKGIPILFGTDATSLEPRARSWWKVWVKRRLLPAIFRLATVAIAPSGATAEYLESLGMAKDRVVVTPFVVDNDYWTSRSAEVNRQSVRAAWGFSESSLVVLFCAKLQPWKRPQDVLRAFAKASVPDARLLMAGDGPLLADLQREAQALGCSERVKFAGFTNQSALPEVYTSADVMVLPSEYDPCPVVVCESMLCGCPVILSDKIRGRAELVRSGETGYYYRCGDVGALAGILHEALSDRERLARMRDAARKRMETWSPHENIEAHVQAIGRALSLMRRQENAVAAA